MGRFSGLEFSGAALVHFTAATLLERPYTYTGLKLRSDLLQTFETLRS